MKKLWNILVLTLAINFVAVAAGVGYLVYAKHLDREKVLQIRQIMFPPPVEVVEEPEEEPAPAEPTLVLDELLEKYTGFSSTEKIEQVQHAFDAQLAQLERRQQELRDLQAQIDLAKQQLARDREALARDQDALRVRQEEQARLLNDKGFQDSLALYETMPAKQVKEVFKGLDDPTVIRYLQAMKPRTAARVIKEFKTPEEISRIQRIMELMRQAEPAPQPTAQANVSTEGP